VPKRFHEDLLPYLLARAGALTSARFYRELRLTGTSMTRWRLLSCLYAGAPRSVGDVAAEIILEQSAATRLIERSARAGLVVKRADPADRRRSLVRITPQGRALIRDVARRAVGVDAGILAALPAPARRRLKGDLKRVIAALAAPETKSGAPPKGSAPLRGDGRKRR
jgi:DNA-binding MarR family transcriptional regulator